METLQDNLSYPKTKVSASVELCIDDMGWKLTSTDKTEMIDIMTRRIRNLCRCVQQGCIKNQSAEWVESLPWNCTAKRPAAEAAPESSLPASAHHYGLAPPEYVYGFDDEILLAFRQVRGEKRRSA